MLVLSLNPWTENIRMTKESLLARQDNTSGSHHCSRTVISIIVENPYLCFGCHSFVQMYPFIIWLQVVSIVIAIIVVFVILYLIHLSNNLTEWKEMEALHRFQEISNNTAKKYWYLVGGQGHDNRGYPSHQHHFPLIRKNDNKSTHFLCWM